MKRKGPVTASDFMAQLENDPEYQARRARQEEKEAELKATLNADEEALVAAIREQGYDINSVWDLVNNVPHPVLEQRFVGDAHRLELFPSARGVGQWDVVPAGEAAEERYTRAWVRPAAIRQVHPIGAGKMSDNYCIESRLRRKGMDHRCAKTKPICGYPAVRNKADLPGSIGPPAGREAALFQYSIVPVFPAGKQGRRAKQSQFRPVRPELRADYAKQSQFRAGGTDANRRRKRRL